MRERGDTVLFVAGTEGRAERTAELLTEYGLRGILIDRTDELLNVAVHIAVGQLSKGFRLPGAELQVIAEPDVFEEERTKVERKGDRHRSIAKTFLSDLRDLKVEDLVVHVDHGIGRFVGLKQIGVGDSMQEFMELRYFGEDKLFVPVERLDLVQKYSGTAKPALDKLGGTSWERTKTRVKKAMRDMAEELLKLYAARKAVPGHAFSPDSHWQREFDDAFEWDLTVDQQNAIDDIRRDMESPTPMDRLLCGDVGYGKTEVAMRAAFKAVMDGKQVAFLAPTTVLAFQHQKTLTERFAGFPVTIDMVSRFRSKAEQDQIIKDVGARQDRHHRRHAPAAVERFSVQGPRAARGRRRAALRRVAQGAHQADAAEGRRADDERDAHTANVEHVARGHPRHVDYRDPAERSSLDSDERRQVRFARHRARHQARARARRAGLLRSQPGRVDFLDRRPGAAPRARSARGRGARANGRRRARAGDARLHQQEVRRPARDDDYRERARYSERQHHPHQSRRSLRPVAAVSAARPRRTLGPAGLCVSADSARRRRCRRSRRSGLPPFASSAILAADSALRRSISRSAAPAISSAANKAATSRPSGSRCT